MDKKFLPNATFFLYIFFFFRYDPPTIKGSSRGNRTMMYDRTFGVEIECYAPRGLTFEAVRDAIRAAGVTIYASHSHSGRADATTWVVKPDGSLSGSGTGNGMEIVSRHLNGDAGMDEIRKVCRVLGELNFSVTPACGLHVHVQRPSVGGMRRLAIDYANHEALIDSVLPASRRGTACRWAGTLTRAAALNYAQAREPSDIASVVGHGKYAKVNFTASWLHGTVEFRQHSGTVDAGKIIAWSKFCLRMVDHAERNAVALVAGGVSYRVQPQVQRVTRRFRRSFRGRRFVQLLTRPEGATRDEIFAATGWERGSLSMTRFAREAGLALRSQRLMNGSRRYWGRLVTDQPVATTPTAPALTVADFAPVPVAASLEAFAEMLGMDADEVAYFTGRRVHFAGRYNVLNNE